MLMVKNVISILGYNNKYNNKEDVQQMYLLNFNKNKS